MKAECRQGPEERSGAEKTYRRHLGGYTRSAVLKGITRGGMLVGLVGGCIILANREEKFECSDRCGRCPKFSDGICALGLR